MLRMTACLSAYLLLSSCVFPLRAQPAPSAPNTVVVPLLVNFSGVLTDANHKPLKGVAGVTFALYEDAQGGAPLWMETQNVQPDKTGHYSVMLGSTLSPGLPSNLFASGAARWLGVQAQGQPEQLRVLLVAVPYALKALDAETVGGKPASAFALATAAGISEATKPVQTAVTQPPPTGASPGISGGGKTGYLTEWLSTTKLGDSALFQSSAGNLGISTITPAQKVEVDSGNMLVRGADNFNKAGDTAYVYVGDTNHPIEAIWAGGLALGAYKAPQAIFIQDETGNVGIGTPTPTSPLEVSGDGAKPVVAVNQKGSGNGISASTTAPTAAAVKGLATDSTCFNEPCSAGVLGETTSIVHSTGVMGIVSGRSGTGLSINNGAAIWGDTNVGESAALPVLGTTDDNTAVAAFNNGTDAPSLEGINFTTQGGDVFYAAQALGNGYCDIDTSGNLFCTGSKSAVVPLKSGHVVALYAVEAPENWFEDFGASELRNGSVVISLDPAFTQTVSSDAGYHVFLTPKGDCQGLYVAQETPASFVVRELRGGTSNIAFDYRITARRKGYESIRLADMTEHIKKLQRSLPKVRPTRTAESVAEASVNK
jgi:hypothetical protein